MLATTRKSIPLGDGEVALVKAIQTPGTVERSAIEKLSGKLPANLSEAQAIGLLLDLGKSVVAEAVLNAQYADYAAAIDEDDRSSHQAIRTRRNRVA